MRISWQENPIRLSAANKSSALVGRAIKSTGLKHKEVAELFGLSRALVGNWCSSAPHSLSLRDLVALSTLHPELYRAILDELQGLVKK